MRETESLIFFLLKGKFKRIYYLLKYHSFHKNIWSDTFGDLKKITICKIFGHKHSRKLQFHNGREQADIHCKICGKYLKTLTGKEILKYIRENKLKDIIY